MTPRKIDQTLNGCALSLSALWAVALYNDKVEFEDSFAPASALCAGLIVRRGLTHKNTARHEAGHVLAAYLESGPGSIKSATAIPGFYRSGKFSIETYEGLMTHAQTKDTWKMNLEELRSDARIDYGGKIAEQLTHGRDYNPTGAGADMKNAHDNAELIALIEMHPDCNTYEEVVEKYGNEYEEDDIAARVAEILAQTEEETFQLLAAHKNVLENLASKIAVSYSMKGTDIDAFLEREIPSRAPAKDLNYITPETI